MAVHHRGLSGIEVRKAYYLLTIINPPRIIYLFHKKITVKKSVPVPKIGATFSKGLEPEGGGSSKCQQRP